MKVGLTLLLLITALVGAEEQEPPARTLVKPAIKDIGRGRWQVGRVHLNKTERFVEFPAVVNMDNGLGEYFLVHVSGKLHESVLRTDVDPYQIHVAMLLLGLKGAGTNVWESPTNDIPGEAVSIEVLWKDDKKEKRLRAEELVWDQRRNGAMTKGPWTYNGSIQDGGMFLAQRTGSIISVIADPEALINNPRPFRDDDDNWVVNSRKVPPVETLVRVRIRAEKAAK